MLDNRRGLGDYDEVITRNTLLSPDTGIEEAFKHRSIDLGARAQSRARLSSFPYLCTQAILCRSHFNCYEFLNRATTIPGCALCRSKYEVWGNERANGEGNAFVCGKRDWKREMTSLLIRLSNCLCFWGNSSWKGFWISRHLTDCESRFWRFFQYSYFD